MPEVAWKALTLPSVHIAVPLVAAAVWTLLLLLISIKVAAGIGRRRRNVDHQWNGVVEVVEQRQVPGARLKVMRRLQLKQLSLSMTGCCWCW